MDSLVTTTSELGSRRRIALPVLWLAAAAVTVGSAVALRFAGDLAWMGYSVIAPSTLDHNEAFIRDLSLAGIALGIGLILIATWRSSERT